MKKLIKGIVDFRQNSLTEYCSKFSKLALGQSPDTLFIACCDSRVVPNTFASSDPGDLFVVRNIGNLVPPHSQKITNHDEVDLSVAAAIEFSLFRLNVTNIIICGHSECGAMQSFFNHTQPNPKSHFINHWLEFANPSYQRFQNHSLNFHSELASHNALSQINVIQQLDHLKTYPEVTERLKSNQLKIHGWWFDLSTADVCHYDKNSNEFIVIDENQAEQILSTL